MSPAASPYLDAQAGCRRLRVAVLMPASSAACGIEELLEDLRAASYIDFAGLYCFDDGGETDIKGNLVLRGYLALDGSVCPGAKPVAHNGHARLSPTELRAELERVSSEGARLDVLLCPAFAPSLLRLACLAREGMWWLGANGAMSATVDYLNDLRGTALGDAPMSFGLWATRSADDPPRLLKSASTRQLSSFSVNINRASLRPLRRHLWLACLRLLALGKLVPEARGTCEEAARRARSALDSVFTLSRWIGSMAVRHITHRLRRRGTIERWRVGWRTLAAQGEGFTDVDGYRWLDSACGNWYADPHLLERNGRHWLFMEEFEAGTGRGRIVCAELTDTGLAGAPQPVLERPYHLSYPHLVVDGDEVFMIPESGANNTVELYRAVEFPYRWELVRVLYRGPAFDTTVLHSRGRYWFFTSLVEGEHRVATQLVLFSAERLDGEWQLHPASPLSCDAGFARNAGPLFYQGGRLIRPAQDCSVEYGGALRFQEVGSLDVTEFREQPAGRVLPDHWPGTVGVHTYGRTSRFEVIDRLERLRLR